MAAKNNNLVNNPVDFSVPWKLSDIVLVVEDQKFHARRGTLAYWSPVFENMFTSEFKEKYSSEIHLPGKKASEIKELLHIMYPSMEEKPVTKYSCYFLFELAHEYQIESIVHKCEHVWSEFGHGQSKNGKGRSINACLWAKVPAKITNIDVHI